jgi:Skp family chaperone for outer membrane proteins
MNIVRAAGLIVGVTVAVGGLAGPAFAATPEPPRTVDSMKAKVDGKAQHITAKLQALQSRLATKPKLAAARTTLQADITKALADTATWRTQVDAATTKDGIRAADPAHQTVKADLVKLQADLAAAKGATKTAG